MLFPLQPVTWGVVQDMGWWVEMQVRKRLIEGRFPWQRVLGVSHSSHRSKRAMQFRTRATWHTHVQQWGIPHEPLRHEIRAGKSLPLLCASFAPPFSLFNVNPSFLQLTYSHLNVCGVKHLSLLITHRWSLLYTPLHSTLTCTAKQSDLSRTPFKEDVLHSYGVLIDSQEKFGFLKMYFVRKVHCILFCLIIY